MKSVAALTLLALCARAQNDTDDGAPDLRKFSHIVKMINTQITTSKSQKEVGKMIQNYGCHCFPGMSKIAGGAGPAQDAMDELCRELARCHKCIEFEYGHVNADTDKYRWQVENDGSITCTNSNDQAKFDLCTCDAHYAMQLKHVWDDNTYNYKLWLNRKNQLADFDYDNICAHGTGNNADACCGTSYPNKSPYDSMTRMCCDVSGKTYNDLTDECCDDGSIKATGSC